MYRNDNTLYLPNAGPALMDNPLLNKGSAFTYEERQSFSLMGLLPAVIESIDEQAERAYRQYQMFNNDMDKHIYLRNIQDTNETLYYQLILNHIEEMMPIIYTPTVGAACEQFSSIYRRGRGLFLAYPERGNIVDILNNSARSDVKIIVITDGERILGLGDQGIGGMGIPIGKLALYTACGGVNPANTLPIVLDVGTNNAQLLSEPMYMGWRHPRIAGEEYEQFIEEVIDAIKNRWPDALIQFEDFAQNNAMPLLQRYKDRVCCFNDDIQGTAAVTVGSLLAACQAAGTKLSEQIITFVGAGSAGCGIAEAIIAQMVAEGLKDELARDRVFMVDRWGLLTDDMQNLLEFQHRLVQKSSVVNQWSNNSSISLMDVVTHAKPTVLIGVSGVPGLFSQEVIQEMHVHCPRPIVLPLSNPTSRVEAAPIDIVRWTQGEALIATGSPFDPVFFNGKSYPIAQCNNSYIFPGLGLGVLACNASRVTDEMLMESSRALAACSPLASKGDGPLLPPLSDIQNVSYKIALAVAKKAVEQGVAPLRTEDQLLNCIERTFWKPEYLKYKRTAL